MKKNILITTQRVDTEDPILNFFLDWLREFAKHYDTVYVVCLQAGTYNLPKNIVILSLGKEAGNTRLGYIVRFYRYVIPLILCRRVSKIFVHMNEVYVVLFSPLYPLRKLLGIRLVWWKTHAKIYAISAFMRHFVDQIFTASEHGFKIATKKKTITGHGINTRYFVPPLEKEVSASVRIAAIGRAVPVKHYEMIIDAAAELLKTTRNFSISIVGVRPEDDGEYVKKLKQQIITLGLSEHVSLKPSIPFSEMVNLYQRIDVVVSTTYPYTFDKVPLEAMSCGVIPITPTPSYKPILEPYNLFPAERTPTEIARALGHVCHLSGEERQKLGRLMRDEIVEHHNVEKLIKRISEY